MPKAYCISIFTVLLTGLVSRADHDHRSHVKKVYRTRMAQLESCYDAALDALECEYRTSRERLECAIREARVVCEPERRCRLRKLSAARHDLLQHYLADKRALRRTYECDRREVRNWYHAALHRNPGYAEPLSRVPCADGHRRSNPPGRVHGRQESGHYQHVRWQDLFSDLVSQRSGYGW